MLDFFSLLLSMHWAARFPHFIQRNFSLTPTAHCTQRRRTQPDSPVSNIKRILLEVGVCMCNYKRKYIYNLMIYFKKKSWIWEGVMEIWKELDGWCKYIFHIWFSVVFNQYVQDLFVIIFTILLDILWVSWTWVWYLTIMWCAISGSIISNIYFLILFISCISIIFCYTFCCCNTISVLFLTGLYFLCCSILEVSNNIFTIFTILSWVSSLLLNLSMWLFFLLPHSFELLGYLS